MRKTKHMLFPPIPTPVPYKERECNDFLIREIRNSSISFIFLITDLVLDLLNKFLKILNSYCGEQVSEMT